MVKGRQLFVKKGREFFCCPHCQIELQWPLPSLKALQAYYDQSFSDGMYQEFTAAHAMKRMTAGQRIKEVQRSVAMTGRWLDVGCANGVFVAALADKQIAAEGVELSLHAVESGREQGLPLQLGTIEDIPSSERFDAITAFDVLEHVRAPNPFLAAIRQRLHDGGHVILTVPNAGGIVRRLMGRRWYFYIPEEHLHYFHRRNLSALLEQHGFAVVEVGATHKPMTFDYALTQFAEYNPLIYRVLKAVSRVVPAALRSRPIPLPIGELRIIGRKLPAAVASAGDAKVADESNVAMLSSQTGVSR